MYRIGEFEKITGLPVKTLRYYDDINLLKPSYVDEFTNYRYYTDNNIVEANFIKNLKLMGFTLEEICSLKNEFNIEMIDSKISQLEFEIEENKNKIIRLNTFRDYAKDSEISKVKNDDKKLVYVSNLENKNRAS